MTYREEFNSIIEFASLTPCGCCGEKLNLTELPETAMGAVKCPSCGKTVDQRGMVHSNNVIADRATAYHPKLGRNVLIDADVLTGIVGHRKGRLMPLDKLRARGKGTEGYSSERQRLADITKPLIIDSQSNVIDGRHRHLKLVEKGRFNARVVRATAKEIEKAAIIQRL